MSIIQLRRGRSNPPPPPLAVNDKAKAGPAWHGCIPEEDTAHNFLVRQNNAIGPKWFTLKVLCFELRWKYPWSAVWLESSLALLVGGCRFNLLYKRVRQASPSPWKSACMPYPWSDLKDAERATATLDEINSPRTQYEDGFERVVKAMKKADKAKEGGGEARVARAAAALDRIQARQV